MNRVSYPVVDISGIIENRVEIEEGTPPRVVEDKIYVAVGKDLKEGESTLRWALQKSQGRPIGLLHVHQPADKIPIMGTKFRISQLEPHQVKAYHEAERQNMHQLLEKYVQICQRAGVIPEVQHIEIDSIEKGIVELIIEYGVKLLVMGAASDRQFNKRMVDLRSKKAIYVRLQAAASCKIWFVCKGNLIYTRQGRVEENNVGTPSPLHQANTNSRSGQISYRSQSVSEGQNTRLGLDSPTPNYRRVISDNLENRMSGLPLPDSNWESTPRSRLNAVGSAMDQWNGLPQRTERTPSSGSRVSMCSSDSGVISYVITEATEASEIESDCSSVPRCKEDPCQSSPPSVLACVETNTSDELYDQLVQTMAEADNSKRDAFEEAIRRRKAEKDAIEAIRRVKASESLYADELRRRLEIEEALGRTKEEHEKIKKELDKVVEELCMALEQKSSLETQIADSDRMVQELEQKMLSAIELLQTYKKERDELQVERDNAVRMAEELRGKQVEEASSSSVSQFYSEFSFSEIEEATCNFDQSLKIGEGGYGSIFRCVLRHTQVAIKMLHPHSMQGPSEFQQEVNVLSKLRHPNLVTLIGACPEAWILIYEYLSGGSLEDRLSCKDNTPPLTWQNRIRIATELCSVLIFLHACGVVHGDLKPANILLDGNLVSKLSDFGICRVLSQDEFSSNNTTLCRRTDPKGTFVYMDPEFLSSGELTSKSDVYSFGIILLRLLTGKSALGITKEVQYALDKGNLKNVLDPTAGDWPFVQAKQLAHLALNCCDVARKNRPDLASDARRVLEPMRVSCGVSSFRLNSGGRCQIPHYFICPIFQEIMQDPVVAADGFTYEAEALRGWLDSGHNTSPMTNLELADFNFVPNHALRSAIQEWLQQP